MSDPNARKIYRVVQWATGNIGTRSLRTVIEHPQLQLFGLLVHSENKEGKDARRVIRIAAHRRERDAQYRRHCRTQNRLRLYMQQGANIDDICRLHCFRCNDASMQSSSTNLPISPSATHPICYSTLWDMARRRANSSSAVSHT